MSVAAAPAAAHPHVFVDAGIEFSVDDEGRATGVKVRWTFDAFVTIYILEEQGLDKDGDGRLDVEEAKAFAAKAIDWKDGFDGDIYLSAGEDQLDLAPPRDPSAELKDGRMSVTFYRDIKTPAPTRDAAVVARIYDPSYFIAYSVRSAMPAPLGAAGDCRAEIKPFEASPALFDLQTTLSALSREETPKQQNVGALFSDVVTLTCG